MTNPRDRLITLPNPRLRQRSKRVGAITKDILKIINDMETTVIDWEDSREHEVGVALASVQIDQLYKIIIVRNDYDNKEDRTFKAFINPSVTKHEGELVEDFEGCLSIQDIYGKVPRYPKIHVKAIDIEGKPFKLVAEGFLARVLQHEIDHTKGIVFIEHIKNVDNAFFKLNPEGNLEQLDDKTVQNSRILW
jgi:peptide deformylase